MEWASWESDACMRLREVKVVGSEVGWGVLDSIFSHHLSLRHFKESDESDDQPRPHSCIRGVKYFLGGS